MDSYQRSGLIGKGTYGSVYEAKNIRANTLHAIKRIHVDQYSFPSLHELDIMSRFQHPYLLNAEEIVIEPDHINIVMPLATSDVWNLYIKKRWNEKHNVAELAWQLIQATQFLHEQGFVHCDIRSKNVMVFQDENRICLGDFSIAAKKNQPDSVNHNGSFVCTLEQCPPEWLLDNLNGTSYNHHLDDFISLQPLLYQRKNPVSVDWWSVGIVVYEIVNNKTLCAGCGDAFLKDYFKFFDDYESRLRHSDARFETLFKMLLSPNVRDRSFDHVALSQVLQTKLFPPIARVKRFQTQFQMTHAHSPSVIKAVVEMFMLTRIQSVNKKVFLMAIDIFCRVFDPVVSTYEVARQPKQIKILAMTSFAIAVMLFQDEAIPVEFFTSRSNDRFTSKEIRSVYLSSIAALEGDYRTFHLMDSINTILDLLISLEIVLGIRAKDFNFMSPTFGALDMTEQLQHDNPDFRYGSLTTDDILTEFHERRLNRISR